MDRRAFIGAVACTLLPIPAAVAQQTGKVRRIGFLSPDDPPTTPAEFELIERVWRPLRDLGWIEGQNLIVERRYAGNRTEILRPLAEELIRFKVEIIVTNGTTATLAAKNATTTIPIVMFAAGDPVAAGFAASLARPGGNITGYSIIAKELDAKRLGLLRELLPAVERVGELENSSNPYFGIRRNEYEQLFRSLGMQPILIEVATATELENAVAEVARRRGQALIVGADSLFDSSRVPLMRAALRYALPTMVDGREMLEAGGLVSYNSSDIEQRRQLAYFVDKILRGANPADLPIQQPTQFRLLINLKTAKALGITIPQSLLLRADEVIH